LKWVLKGRRERDRWGGMEMRELGRKGYGRKLKEMEEEGKRVVEGEGQGFGKEGEGGDENRRIRFQHV
jgi:hypothetical protein